MRALVFMASTALVAAGLSSPGRAAGQTCSVTEIAPGVKMRGSNCLPGVARPVAVRRSPEPMALMPPQVPPADPFSVIESHPWPQNRGGGLRVRQ